MLIASLYEKLITTRRVYLPAGDKWCNFWTGEWHDGGKEIEVDVPLHVHGCVMICSGAIIPTGPILNYIGERGRDNERIVLIFPPPGEVTGDLNEFLLIEDDGESLNAPTTEIKIWMRVENSNHVTVGFNVIKHDYKLLEYEYIWFMLPQNDHRRLIALKDISESRVLRRNVDGRDQLGLRVGFEVC